MPRAVAGRPYPGVAAIDLEEDITVDLLLVVGAHLDVPLREALLRLGDKLTASGPAAPATGSAKAPTRRSAAPARRARRA
jgi:hypothetical protein